MDVSQTNLTPAGLGFAIPEEASSRELDLPLVNTMLWGGDVRIGSGISATAGVELPVGIQPFSPSPLEGSVTQFRSRVYTHRDNYAMIDDLVSPAVTHSPFHIARLDLTDHPVLVAIRDTPPSSTSFVLCVLWTRVDTLMSLTSEDFALTLEAADLCQSNPSAFRDAYGDYFVSGAYTGVQLAATIKVTCNTPVACRQLEDEIYAKIENVNAKPRNPHEFDFVTSTALQEVLTAYKVDHEVSVEIRISSLSTGALFPLPSAPVLDNIDRLYAFLPTLGESRHPSYLAAELRHYSLVPGAIGSLSPTLPNSWQTFHELHAIRTRLLSCTISVSRLAAYLDPSALVDDLRAKEMACRDRCRSLQDMISPSASSDGSEIAEHTRETLTALSELHRELERFVASLDLWFIVLEQQSLELQNAPSIVKKTKTWSFGTRSAPHIDVYSRKISRVVSKRILGSHAGDVPLEIAAEPEEHIVGWSVSSGHGYGSVVCADTSVILGNKATLTARPDRLNDETWDLEVFLVKDKYFSALVDKYAPRAP